MQMPRIICITGISFAFIGIMFMDKQTILIVEDEATLQKTLQEVLTQEGFTLLSALDGELGLELARKHKPDLILLDLILPKKDGFEVLEALKADEATKEIPIIILTNLEGSADVQKALELGATTYLVKANYELEDVIGKVRETIKK